MKNCCMLCFILCYENLVSKKSNYVNLVTEKVIEVMNSVIYNFIFKQRKIRPNRCKNVQNSVHNFKNS